MKKSYKLAHNGSYKKIRSGWKKNVISIILVGTLLIGVNKGIKNSKTDVSDNITTTENVTLYIDAGEDIPVKVDNNNKIYFSNAGYNKLIEYINNIDSNYEYGDHYQIESTLNKINNFVLVSSSDDIRDKKGNITAENLYNKVISNNENYLQDKNNVVKAFYQKMTDSEVLNICKIVAEIVDKAIKEDEKIDVTKLSSNLCKLKILETNSSAGNMARTTSDYCLIVSPAMMKIYEKMHEEKDTNYDTLVHEVNHIIQSDYLEKKVDNVIEKSGICVKYSDQNINSLYWSWLLESSAEKIMHNLTGHETTMYPNQISYLETISLCNILNSDVEVGDAENMCFTNDINSLYKLFGVTSDEEKSEIIKMMYNIEIIEQRNPEEFINLYNQLNMVDLSKDKDLLNEVKQNLRIEVYQTLSKFFYRNLANKIHDGNVTVQDVFYLIRIFESDMNVHLLYTEKDKFIATNDFISEYIVLQTNFFDSIGPGLGYDEFRNYSMKAVDASGNIYDNCSLSFLNDEKRKYLLQMQESVYKKGMPILADIKISSFSK